MRVGNENQQPTNWGRCIEIIKKTESKIDLQGNLKVEYNKTLG